MIGGQEIARTIQGGLLILQNRREGVQWFDVSIDGFWRSFGVIFLVLPLFLISGFAEKKLLLEETELTAEIFPGGAFWSSEMTTFALDWVTLPLVLALLARPLGISGGYVSFVVVRNWTSLLAAVPYVFSSILYLLGIVPSGVMVLMSLMSLSIMLWFKFNIVRFTLDTGVGLTLGVVVLDVILSLMITELAGRMWT